jgi:2-polyprenyl-6-methoxyphenol hydroxylase-like FAD-dependent oxidoreductase
MRVIVVGAGVGGLTLAQGLRRAGVDVAVYERDGTRGRTQGVSLHFDDRGAEALRACLPPGHVAMAEATMGGVRDRTLLLSDVAGELAVTGTRPADGQGGRRPGRQANRRMLRAVLLHGLDEAVRFDTAFTRYERQPDGTVRAWFSDGSTDHADVLVGADGLGSAVRRQYLPHARVVDTGKRMVMGATPLRSVAATGLAELLGNDAAVLQQGDTMMVVAAHPFAEPLLAVRDRWLPTLTDPAITESEDYVMWALQVTEDQLGPVEAPEEVWRLAGRLVAGLHPTLRLVVDEAWTDLSLALRIGMIPPVPDWDPSPVTLIGDAIHAAPGFGANLAMQDARRLRDALVRADRGEQDLLAAIESAERLMRRDGAPTLDADGRAAVRA